MISQGHYIYIIIRQGFDILTDYVTLISVYIKIIHNVYVQQRKFLRKTVCGKKYYT